MEAGRGVVLLPLSVGNHDWVEAPPSDHVESFPLSGLEKGNISYMLHTLGVDKKLSVLWQFPVIQLVSPHQFPLSAFMVISIVRLSLISHILSLCGLFCVVG